MWPWGHDRSRNESAICLGARIPLSGQLRRDTSRGLRSRPQYVRDGVELTQGHLRRIPQFADAVVMPGELLVTSTDVSHMTAEQWALVNEYRALMPGATVALRQHKIG